jgi:hypothetical protein
LTVTQNDLHNATNTVHQVCRSRYIEKAKEPSGC